MGLATSLQKGPQGVSRVRKGKLSKAQLDTNQCMEPGQILLLESGHDP